MPIACQENKILELRGRSLLINLMQCALYVLQFRMPRKARIDAPGGATPYYGPVALVGLI